VASVNQPKLTEVIHNLKNITKEKSL